jgi:hypothetical protein
MNITSPRAEAWRDHLHSKEDVTCESVVDDTASCLVDTESVYVTIVRVNVVLG